MERREFLRWVGVGFLASSLPVAIAACNDKSSNSAEVKTSDEILPPPKSTSKNENVNTSIAVGLIDTLDQNGQILNEDHEIIVIRDPENENLIALSAKCTHKGCLVNWQEEDNNFICPCHDSLFTVNGEVIEGPAKEALAIYSARENEGQILVDISS